MSSERPTRVFELPRNTEMVAIRLVPGPAIVTVQAPLASVAQFADVPQVGQVSYTRPRLAVTFPIMQSGMHFLHQVTSATTTGARGRAYRPGNVSAHGAICWGDGNPRPVDPKRASTLFFGSPFNSDLTPHRGRLFEEIHANAFYNADHTVAADAWVLEREDLPALGRRYVAPAALVPYLAIPGILTHAMRGEYMRVHTELLESLRPSAERLRELYSAHRAEPQPEQVIRTYDEENVTYAEYVFKRKIQHAFQRNLNALMDIVIRAGRDARNGGVWLECFDDLPVSVRRSANIRVNRLTTVAGGIPSLQAVKATRKRIQASVMPIIRHEAVQGWVADTRPRAIACHMAEAAGARARDLGRNAPKALGERLADFLADPEPLEPDFPLGGILFGNKSVKFPGAPDACFVSFDPSDVATVPPGYAYTPPPLYGSSVPVVAGFVRRATGGQRVVVVPDPLGNNAPWYGLLDEYDNLLTAAGERTVSYTTHPTTGSILSAFNTRGPVEYPATPAAFITQVAPGTVPPGDRTTYETSLARAAGNLEEVWSPVTATYPAEPSFGIVQP